MCSLASKRYPSVPARLLKTLHDSTLYRNLLRSFQYQQRTAESALRCFNYHIAAPCKLCLYHLIRTAALLQPSTVRLRVCGLPTAEHTAYVYCSQHEPGSVPRWQDPSLHWLACAAILAAQGCSAGDAIPLVLVHTHSGWACLLARTLMRKLH